MANSSRLDLQINTSTTGDASIDRLSNALEKIAAQANKAGDSLQNIDKRSNIAKVGSDFEHTVPRIAAASGAIREFEGNLPIRAVENFLSTTLGLGPALQAAFPVVGLLAFSGTIAEVLRKMDPLAKAQEAAAVSAKTLDEQYKQLGLRLEQLNVERITTQFGKLAGAKLSAFYSKDSLTDDVGNLMTVRREIEKVKNDLAVSGGLLQGIQGAPVVGGLLGKGVVGFGISEAFKRFQAGKQLQLGSLQGQQDYLAGDIGARQAAAAADVKHAQEEAADAVARHQNEALRNSREVLSRSFSEPTAGRDIRGEMERATSFVNDRGQIQNIKMEDETRRNYETAFHTFAMSLQKQASDSVIDGWKKAYDFAEKRDAQLDQKRRAFDDDTSRMVLGTNTAAFAHQGDLLGYSRDQRLQATEFSGVIPLMLRPRGMDAGDFGRYRDQLRASNALGQIKNRAGIESDYALKSSVLDAEQVKRDQEGALAGVDIARLAGSITPAQALERTSAINADAGQRGAALNDRYDADTQRISSQAALDSLKTITDLQDKTVEHLQEIMDRQSEMVGQFTGGLFNAATSRSPTAIRDFVRSQALGFGGTLATNFGKDYVTPALQHIIPKSSSSLFKGTLFEKTSLKDAADPLNAAPALTSSATDLTNSAAALTQAAATLSGGRGGMGGSSGISAAARSGWNVYSASGISPSYTGTQLDPGPDNLPLMNYGGTGTGSGQASAFGINVPSAGSSSSGLGFNAGTVGKIAGATGAGFLAYQGFKKGGAGGALQGASGIAGAAALFDPEPISKAALTIVAAATSLIGGLINNPQKRENTISGELSSNQYMAPTALNVTQSSNGNFADFDAKGNLRTSGFSAVPSVSEPYIWQRTHGLFGGPPTYYDVPGGQTGQFTSSPTQQPTTVIIHAMDSQSFSDFADRNHMAFGNATAKALQNAHGTLTNEVQRAANG